MNLIVRGQTFQITVEDVLRATTGVAPAPLARYAVRLHDQWYPPKQVLSLVTGLPVAAFTTQDAYRTLHRLGLHVIEASQIPEEPEAHS